MDSDLSARRRITVALFLSQAFFSASMIAAFTLLPILAAQLSGKDSAAGLPSTINLVGRAAAAYPIGWLMDKIGRRFGLSVGFGLAVVGMSLSAWSVYAGSFFWFLVGAGLYGMGRSASEMSRYVAAEVQLPERRANAMGLLVFASTFGAIGGPMLVGPSGRLAERLGFLEGMGPFVVGALLSALGLVLVWGLLRPDPKTLAVKESLESARDHERARPLREIFSDARVLLAVAAMTIGQLVMTLIMVITPLHMNHNDHSKDEISLVIMAHTLGMFGLAWLTGRLVARFGKLTVMLAGALILVVSALLTPPAGTVPALAVALFLLGLGWNFCFVAGSSLLAESIAVSERGRVQGAGEVVVALSSGVGSLGTGFVFASGGIAAVSAVGLAFLLALLAGVAWFSRWRRATVEPA